jgi:hypothetical protein
LREPLNRKKKRIKKQRKKAKENETKTEITKEKMFTKRTIKGTGRE